MISVIYSGWTSTSSGRHLKRSEPYYKSTCPVALLCIERMSLCENLKDMYELGAKALYDIVQSEGDIVEMFDELHGKVEKCYRVLHPGIRRSSEVN